MKIDCKTMKTVGRTIKVDGKTIKIVFSQYKLDGKLIKKNCWYNNKNRQ